MRSTRREALSMQQDELLRVYDGMGATVVVRGGEVWLTQDGDERDVFLGPGESFTLDVAAPAMLQAMAPACVLLVEPSSHPRPYGPLARAWARLRAKAVKVLDARHPRVEPWAPRGAGA